MPRSLDLARHLQGVYLQQSVVCLDFKIIGFHDSNVQILSRSIEAGNDDLILSRTSLTFINPQANSIIENLSRHFKAALMLLQNANRLEALPLVLLRIRMTFKESISATSTYVLYGEPIRLPGKSIKNTSPTNTHHPSEVLQ